MFLVRGPCTRQMVPFYQSSYAIHTGLIVELNTLEKKNRNKIETYLRGLFLLYCMLCLLVSHNQLFKS